MEERRERWLPFFSRREANALGEGNPQALMSDKVGLGPGRRRKRALRPPRASSQTALPSARLAQKKTWKFDELLLKPLVIITFD